MKTKFKLLALCLSLALITASFIGCGKESKSVEDEKNSTWADQYESLIKSGEARDYKDYNSLKKELDKIRKDSGATYVYAMSPVGEDKKPSLDGDVSSKGSFAITVDGSEEPDAWGENYGFEIQFEEAWKGQPAAARSAWNDNDEGTEICWSAFAPVKNNKGEVVCILGIDYPANNIKDYLEWNRDSDKWNKIEDNINVKVPEAVQKIKDDVTNLASKYAKELSK